MSDKAAEKPGERKCRWCNGTGVNVMHHYRFGPQVDECPDCEGTGIAPPQETADDR